MPIHLEDVDVASEVAGLRSVLIVPCNMCPAVTVAVREEKPFLRLHRNPLQSEPFERHIKALQSRLREEGVSSRVFESNVPHQWFMCMWTASRRKKLQRQAGQHQAVIVLGCESATETVRLAVGSANCKVIEGMAVAGITNARLTFRLPGNLCFEDCTVVPLSQKTKEEQISH